MATGGCWSEAPFDLLWSVIERLSFGDLIRFGAVCVSWRALLHDNRRLPAQVPWLMLRRRRHTKFFSLPENRTYTIDPPLTINNKHQCIGSSDGWLVFLDQGTYDKIPKFHIFNPLSGIQPRLPSITTLPNFHRVSRGIRGQIDGFYIRYPQRCLSHIYANHLLWDFRKAIVSQSPTCSFSFSSPGSFVVAVIFLNSIVFARAGDQSWTGVETPEGIHFYDHFDDIVFYREQLYAVRISGEVLACSLSADLSHKVTVNLILPPPDNPPHYIVGDQDLNIKYLVESSDGNLLQVWRQMKYFTESESYRTVLVVAFVLKDSAAGNNDSNTKYWVPLTTLEDDALFLGLNYSIAVPVENFSELRRNCIYFSDNREWYYYRSSPCDLGVYNMNDGTLIPYYQTEWAESRPPVWYIPKHGSIPANKQ